MGTTTNHRDTTSYGAFERYFDAMHYPSGEIHVSLRNSPSCRMPAVIEAAVHGFEGIGRLLTADAILRRHDRIVTWFVPYFPFARHDRRNHAGDGFELGVALDLVSGLDIVIADPHSDVAGQLRHIPQSAAVDCFRDAGALTRDAMVVVPDTGATKKAHEWAEQPFVQALKHRDPMTGQLSGFEVLVDDLQGAPCVIVDDICDGGGTFLGLAKELEKKNAGPLTLAVTHGLFTKGVDQLSATFDRIITFGFEDGPRLAGVEYLPFHDLYTKGAQR